ncbi:MAG: DUF108 domain-containing protein [Proteobacteria bacterium]|nr:DUF108 domain-containing protein [Pseudomonadota bacterium]
MASRFHAGAIPAVRLTAVSARDLAKARTLASQVAPAAVAVPLEELPAYADIIIECATHEAFPEIARVALTAGKVLIPVSVGALAAHPEIIDLAAKHRGLIKIASGALPGLDALRSAAEGAIKAVRLENRTRPELLADEPAVLGQGLDLTKPLAAPIRVFAGSARAAAAAFPRHLNIAVTLSLAGIGLDRTTVEVWADTTVRGPVITVEVEAEDVTLRMTSRNIPSPGNPRTSRIVALSILAAVRGLISPLQIGS